MAYKRAELYYLSNNAWVHAVTHSGNSALVDVRLLDIMGNSRKLGVTLSNIPKDFTSTNSVDRTGLLSSVFQDYQHVLLRDGYTQQILFKGRIYNISKDYNPSYGGNTITLECFDALGELRDFSTRGLNTKTYNWNNYDLISQRRNTVIERLITDSIGNGNAYLNQNSRISSINNTDTGSGSGTRFRYEISAVQMASDVGKIQPKRRVGSSILEQIHGLASEDPHTSDTADKSHGYTYYTDPNMVIAKPVLGNWDADTAVEINPPQMLNYFKRGTRPTSDPSTHGLTVRFGTDTTTITTGTDYQIDKTLNQSYAPNTVATIYNTDGSVDTANDGALYRKGTKVMLASYQFGKPSQELYTDVLLTYSTKGEKGGQDTLISQRVELLNVSSLANISVGGSPFYIGQDLFDHTEHPNAEKNPPGKLQWQNSSGTWADVKAYVHFASATSSSSVASNGSDPVTDYEQVIIGIKSAEIEDFETQMTAIKADSNATAIPMRVLLWSNTAYNNTSSTTFTFNSTITSLGKGRAKEAFGSFRRSRNISDPDLSSIESIRKRMYTSLARTNMDIRRGTFTVSGAPFYSVDLKVKTVSSDVFTFESIGASTSAIDLTTLGVKVGFAIQNFGTDSTFTTEVANNNASDYNNGPSFGYIKTMASDTQISCGTSDEDGLSYGWTHTVPSVGHYVRIHIPLRAGDYLRVECPQDQIAGNHIITSVDFMERGGTVQTTIETIGRNEDIALTTSLGISSNFINTQIAEARKSGEWSWDADSLPMGQRKFRLHGFTFTRTDYRTLTWSTGSLEIDGKYYTIATGSTYSTNSNTHLANDAQSYIYFNADVSTTAFITRNEATQYVPDGDDVLIGTARANTDTSALCIFWLYGEDPSKINNLDIYKNDPDIFIGNRSITAALSKKGAQEWTTNIAFEGTDYNVVRWGLSSSIGSAGAVSFADDTTEAVNANTGETFSSGTTWVYKRVDSDASTNLVLTQTYTDVTRADTDRILMATVVVAADVGQGSPTIFPMNGNTPTLSVGSFAARSILADDIKAGTITADEIAAGTITTTQVNFAPGNTTFRVDDPPTATAIGDIWFDTNDGNKTYRASATGSGNWVATTLSKAGIGLGNVDNDSTSTIRSGTTKSNVGLGNVDNDSTSTIRQGTTKADVGLGNVDNDSTSTIRSGTTKSDVGLSNVSNITTSTMRSVYEVNATGSIAGIEIATDKMYIGTGTVNNANTSFYVDALGNFSLKDKFYWNGTALVIDGSGTFSGALSAATGTFSGSVSVASAKILINDTGIHIKESGSTRFMLFEDSSGVEQSGIYSSLNKTIWYTPEGKSIVIGREGQSTTPLTDNITFAAKNVTFITQGENPSYLTHYEFPSFNPSDDDHLGVYDWDSGTRIADLRWTSTSASDSRKKTDIIDFSNADSLALINSLRPRKFKKLDHGGATVDKLRYGLIAQEVEEALTGLSIDKTKLGLIELPSSDDEFRRLGYTELIAPLIGAVKELKARIEALEA